MEPGEERRPYLLWELVAAASFVSPLLIVLGRSFLFTADDPASSHRPVEAEAETTCVEREGCESSGRSSVSRRESTAPLVPVSSILPRVGSRNKVGRYTAVGGMELAEEDGGTAAEGSSEVGGSSSPVAPDTPGMP